MPDPSPTLDEWRRLYDAASRIHRLAPWTWMEEDELFAVQDPETDRLGFVSIMGALGEHLAVALYLGAKGLDGFWQMHEGGPFTPPEQILLTPHLQASFEDRTELEAEDRSVIKELGLRFRGRQAWPLFRSFRPAYYPWFLDAHEARFLAHALEQVLDVAPRVREDPDLLVPEEDATDEELYLLRVPTRTGAGLTWTDAYVSAPELELPLIEVSVEYAAMVAAKALPRSQNTLEVDLFLFPVPIGPRGQRAYFAHGLMTVDSRSGFVFANDLLPPEPSLEAMLGTVPQKFVEHLLLIGQVPQEVHLRSLTLHQVVAPTAAKLGIELRLFTQLPALDEARESLERFMRA